MTISLELIAALVIQLITVGIFVGTYKQTISFMQQQIADLKDDMHKYNNVLERLAIAELSTQTAHKRIDVIEGSRRYENN